jgi:Ca2+-binding EF-hand superfamily protein
MQHRRLVVPVLGALVLATATGAFAGRGFHHGPSFEDVDTDKNGSISLQEATTSAQNRATEKFQKLDADKDGAVTKEELQAARQAKREQRKQSMPVPF